MINFNVDPDNNTIKSKYKIIEQINGGAFGSIYKIYDKNRKKYYAMKRVTLSPDFKNRELEVSLTINNINCTKVLDFYYDKNNNCTILNIIMKLVENNLLTIIEYFHKQVGYFPDLLAKVYIYQLIRGLSYLHTNNIIHRDIKPENILVNDVNSRLFICDFGCSKFYNTNEESEIYVGSRNYRSPELILGKKNYDFKTDIWSLGCVISEVFLGKPLFIGRNEKEILNNIMKLLGTPEKNIISKIYFKKNIKIPFKIGFLIKNKFYKYDKLLIDLLEKILKVDPDDRENCSNLLNHEYFKELHIKNIINKKINFKFNLS